MWLTVVASLLVPLLSGCGDDGRIGTSAPSTPGAASRQGRFDVGDHEVAYRCTGSGGAGVLLEAPFLTDSSIWAPIEKELESRDFAGTVCAYDRAGLGDSPSIGAHTIEDSVNDLRALVTGIPLGPPRVFVGYSYGGLVIRLLAARHAGLVDGMVLVEATPTGFHDKALPLLPEEEHDAFVAEGNVENVPNLRDAAALVARESTPGSLEVPLVVVIAKRGIEFVDEDHPEVAVQINEIYRRAQAANAELAKNSTAVEAPHSQHAGLLTDDTDVVVDAILAVISDAQ